MAEMIPVGSTSTFHARRDPRRPMLTFGDRTMTRGEFDARANRRARMFASQGVVKGDFVNVVLPNGFEFLETCFALWKLGATPQPVSAALPDPELRAIVDLVRPRLIAGADPARLPGCRVIPENVVIDETLSPDPLPDIECEYWRAVTSGGSTGRPKIIVSHGGTRIDPLAPFMGHQLDGVELNPGPLYHSGPMASVTLALFWGGHVVDGGKFDAENTLRLIEKHGIDWLYLVPTMMHRIWRLPAEVRESYDLSSVKTIWHMAAHCPVWLKRNWIGWLGAERIFELYGATENAGTTTISGPEWLERPGSVGRVSPGGSLAILDEGGQKLPPGEVGEIFFRPDSGLGSTYHYIGAEARTQGDWETPGDLGYVDEEGYLYIVDRRVDMIVSGGANVFPAEVEAALEAHPDVECAIVIGLPDEEYGHRVHALIEPREGAPASFDPSSLREFAAERLVRYKLPKSFELVGTPLRDAAGKVRRSALREQRIAATAAPTHAESAAKG